MLEFFNNNPLFNLITLAIALLGIILTVYFAVRARKSKKPIYAIRTINLVKDKLGKIDRVEMLFDGKRIDNLSISKFALWNEGKDTIRAADVATLNPLKIIISDDYQILDCKITAESDRANGFTAKVGENGKYISLGFEYFDNKEGIVMEISHTGPNSTCLTLTGSLCGVQKLYCKSSQKLSMGPPHSKLDKTIRVILGWGIMIFCILALALVIFVTVVKGRSLNLKDSIYIVMCVLYFLGGYLILPRRTVPKGLDIFNEEF